LILNHFAILKVGPQLTFALREALFALSAIEDELVDPEQCSKLRDTCETIMCLRPESWNKHYSPSDPSSRWLRRYSYSDRIRYYWNQQEIEVAVHKMMENLSDVEIPLPLISQFMPKEYDAVRAGEIQADPHEMSVYHVMAAIALYAEACRVGT
jgi:D-tagatose-1,6-bisphosphate aldolase subunit GatZ/KbaZ